MRTRLGITACLAASLALGGPCLALAETTSQTPDTTSQTVADNGTATDGVEKLAVPTVDKEISVDGENWSDVLDSGSFSHLFYRVKGTLPEYLNWHESYYYAFVDKSDATILVDGSSVHVSLVSPDKTEPEDVTGSFSVTFAGDTMTVACENLKKAFPELTADCYFLLSYEADLGKAADLGMANPNENACHVTYLRDGGDVDNTPDDMTFVYSYALDVSKLEKGTSTKLAGAKFAICDSSGLWLSETGWTHDVAKRTIFTTNSSGQIAISALGTGTYKLVETEAPSGYSKIDPITFTLSRSKDNSENSLSAKAEGAKVTSVDAKSGHVAMAVEDPKTDKDKEPTTPSSNNGTHGSSVNRSSGTSGGSGALSKTGDDTAAMPIVVLLICGASAAVTGIVMRRKTQE